jgi:hypothetical protein
MSEHPSRNARPLTTLTPVGEEPILAIPPPGERPDDLLAHCQALMATTEDAAVLPDLDRLPQRDTCSGRPDVKPR